MKPAGTLLLTAALAAACAPQATRQPETAAPLPSQAFESDLAPLEQAIRERLRGESGEYAVAVIDIETGRYAGINDRLVLHAASTMKVPVLLELYRLAAERALDLEGTVEVRNRFRSIADTTHWYALDTEDDSELTLYERIGQRVTYRELGRLMTVRSSNLATNILIDLVGADAARATAERVGGGDMRVLRGVEDGPAYRAGMNNTTTAEAFARVLAAVARCDVLPPAECAEIAGVLADQEFDEMIPAGLPPGTRVANKTGWITGIQHDGAIVYPDGSPPYVLTVLTRGAADTVTVRRVAADISRLTWEALGPGGSLRPRWPAETTALVALHGEHRLPAFPAPTLGPREYWPAVHALLAESPDLALETIGSSAGGWPLRLVRFGDGPMRVLLWSQMHGDETTASRALADLFAYIAASPDDPRVRRWREQLTVLALPMLNPDGADAHRRRSSVGIDINRDARALATPEGRALSAVQEHYRPEFGFNLHDQNPRSRVGTTGRIAAMSLLAPPPDAAGSATPAFVRAERLTAHIARTVAPLLGGHLTRYDDSYNARAFGDNMQARGVSTVLIETGSWRRDPSKHYLRTANFVALAAALDAIATGAYASADPELYRSLPGNGRPVHDLLIRGGTIVLDQVPPQRADIAIDGAAVGGPASTQIADIGDLDGVEARDTIDATGMFIHAPGTTGAPAWTHLGRVPMLYPGVLRPLQVRRGTEPDSELVWEIDGVRARQLTVR